MWRDIMMPLPEVTAVANEEDPLAVLGHEVVPGVDELKGEVVSCPGIFE